MKFIDSNKLDKNKWDELVAQSPINNITCYSWYLDATTEKWGAYIDKDYSCGIAFPYKKRIFYRKFFQHPYSRNLTFFGKQQNFDVLFQFLHRKGVFRFRLHEKLNQKSIRRVYQVIDLQQPIRYKTNAKRILRKNADLFHFKRTQSPQNLFNLYFSNAFNKIKQQKKNQFFFKQLVANAIEMDKGEVFEAYNEENQCVAAAFFLKDKTRCYYLIGDCNPEWKKKGAVYHLMDFAIQHYKSGLLTFDFGGSNVPSVAAFYHKMGGVDVEYFEYY